MLPGDKLVQKDLARTLRAIRERGAAGFYEGEVGASLVAAIKAGGGIITAEDLQRIAPRELKPIECDYRGYTIVSAPPPSSGGVTLCEMLDILEGYPLKDLGFGSAQALHDEIETMRHAYVDRNNLLGDPDFVDNPVEQAHLQGLRGEDPRRDRSRQGDALGRPGAGQAAARGRQHHPLFDRRQVGQRRRRHLFAERCVRRRHGRRRHRRACSTTTMDDFTAKVGAANLFGLVQGEKNAIEPGKTPLSSMSPTIVVKDGKPVLVVGTPGGSRIITVVLQTILDVIDYGMTISEAVDAPRIHNQWLPDLTNVEPFALSPGHAQDSGRHGPSFRAAATGQSWSTPS